MNKAEFIAGLDERLAVLTDDERRDILDEYEQHIDMKVMRGMSEEAAIADFGRLDELAADILEAYHVRADYAVVEKGKKNGHGRGLSARRAAGVALSEENEAGKRENEAREEAGTGVQDRLNSAFESTWNGVEHACTYAANFVGNIGLAAKKGLRKTGQLFKAAALELADCLKKPFRKKRKLEQETEDAVQKSARRRTERKRKMKDRSGLSLGGMLAGFCKACAAAVLWCVRWMWNLFCICIGTMFGFGSCLAIFAMGALAVLLILGYPLAGVTIGWLGLIMCMVSVTIWCFSMIISKRKRAAEAGGNGIEASPAVLEQEKCADAGTGEREEEEMVHA